MIGRMLIAGVAVASVTLLGGCEKPQTVDSAGGGYREVSAPTGLVAKARPSIADVPEPIGFKLDERRSRYFAAAGARYVDHLYKGRGDKYAVGRFYKRQMPISRWTLVTDRFVQGGIVLDFEKETERCVVQIIKVQLWTSGRIEGPGATVGKGKGGK
jgi:hypothetical protein